MQAMCYIGLDVPGRAHPSDFQGCGRSRFRIFFVGHSALWFTRPSASRLACPVASHSETAPNKSSRFDRASPPSAGPARPEIPTRVPTPE